MLHITLDFQSKEFYEWMFSSPLTCWLCHMKHMMNSPNNLPPMPHLAPMNWFLFPIILLTMSLVITLMLMSTLPSLYHPSNKKTPPHNSWNW